jgi:hypothetical protein
MLLELLLLRNSVLLVEMNFLSVLFSIHGSPATHHVGGLGTWLKTRDSESHRSRLFYEIFFLDNRHLADLRDYDRSALKARASVKIQLNASFYVPFNSLTQPALNKAVTHLKAYNIMLRLHQVVENRALFIFVFVVKHMALHNVLGCVPLLNLAGFFVTKNFSLDVGLMSTNLHNGFVARAVSCLFFDHYLMSPIILRFKSATGYHSAFFQRVGYSHPC